MAQGLDGTLPWPLTVPPPVPGEKAALHQAGMALAECDHVPQEAQHLLASFGGGPVEPTQCVVLTVAVVVPPLGPKQFVPANMIGTPRLKRSIAMRFFACRMRSDRMPASLASPSTPQFQLRFWSLPSRLLSPLASLCFWCS
jgi:hypothetical protein